MRVNPSILVTFNLIKGSLTLIALFQKKMLQSVHGLFLAKT